MDGGAATAKESLVQRLPAQEASRNGNAVVRQDNVVPNINMDVGMDGGAATAEESLVWRLPAREASRNGDGVVRRDNVVPNINMDVRRPGHPEAQHCSIKDSAADAEAMDIDNAVNNNPIGLQIEADTSDKIAKALWLVVTCTPIGGEATTYTSISIKELERAICAKQSHNSLVRRVRQGLATPIKNRPNLAGPDMANAVPGMANMATNMAATMASIWSQWQEINDVVYYNGKIYAP